VNPVVKWAGGKRQILDDIKKLLPENRNAFHEPMLGGGALFFDLSPESGSVNDVNERLVNFYIQVRKRPSELVDRLRGFEPPESSPDPARKFSQTGRDGGNIETYYYQQRELFNRRPNNEEFDELEEAALLLYLNRTCFNGLYRENSDGEFNVPSGDYSNPDWVQEERIIAASEVLESVEIHNRDFQYILEAAKAGDLVYFDPPYKPMSETADFTEYTAEGFGREEQNRLIAVLRKLDERGVYFITSNSGVMADKYRESRFDVLEVEAKRQINRDASKRGEVKEILATNVPREERKGRPQKTLVRSGNREDAN
jgi:DNA adenine methylase